MPSDDLLRLWADVRQDLCRAQGYLPAQESGRVRTAREYLDANELELALDVLADVEE